MKIAAALALAGWLLIPGPIPAEPGPAPAPPARPAEGAVELALSCIKPIKPLLPIKPLWCTGTWTQILACDRQCHCEWQTVCLEQ